MANASDYLQLSQTQLLVPYKLRSRSVGGTTFTATNISQNHVLRADISSTLEQVSIIPSSIELQPGQSVSILVTPSTAQLETFPPGVLTRSLNFLVSATPLPVPPPPAPPPPPPTPAPIDVPGCTDPSAFNYNPSATLNDGTCIAKIFGCTNINALNYNPRANTEDGSCIFTTRQAPSPDVLGCTNPNAFNYNPNATSDDGSCIDKVYGCTDRTATNYNPDANVSCDSEEFLSLIRARSTANIPVNVVCCLYDRTPAQILGCTDPTAKNYDPSATADSGNCIYYTFGCTNKTAINYDPTAEKDDDSCLFSGCTDPLATNYVRGNNIVACADCCTYDRRLEPCLEIGKIVFTGPKQSDGTAAVCRLIQDQFVGGCRESCIVERVGDPTVFGCTDPQAMNYNPSAEQNDGSCVYITGCMDSSAINYNPYAVRDSGNCIYPTPTTGGGSTGGSTATPEQIALTPFPGSSNIQDTIAAPGTSGQQLA